MEKHAKTDSGHQPRPQEEARPRALRIEALEERLAPSQLVNINVPGTAHVKVKP